MRTVDPVAAVPPGDTWPGVLASGAVTALTSGVITGLVAWLTVRWTQRGDAVRARLAASGRGSRPPTQTAGSRGRLLDYYAPDVEDHPVLTFEVTG